MSENCSRKEDVEVIKRKMKLTTYLTWMPLRTRRECRISLLGGCGRSSRGCLECLYSGGIRGDRRFCLSIYDFNNIDR